jgi:hypothetical protein
MVIGAYDPIIAAASRKYGVPESYIRSVMQVESGGRPDAVSGAGAGGLMQIMPATYEELRREHGLGVDRFDPTNNINAGAAYMRQMYDQFGDWGDAFGAYNAGPGRMRQVKAGQRGLPAETRKYIPAVQAGYRSGVARSEDGQERGAGMNFGDVLNRYAGTMRPGAALTEEQLLEQARGGSLPGQVSVGPRADPRGGGRSLLDVDHTNNWLDGLGGLLGEGQTGSQPPGPQISPLQYQLAGAGRAVGELAGVTDRRVGIGELLGALGGGLTQGAAAGQQAQRQQREDVRAEQESRLNNVYKAAMARKALEPDRMNLGDRFKVAGKRIFDAATQTWIDDPNAQQEPGGPFPSEGLPSQLLNTYYTLEQKRVNGSLTPQEQLLYDLTAQQLGKPRLVTGPDGVVREVAPPPLPTLPGAGAGAAPPAAAPPPNLLDVPAPNTGAGAAPPAVAPSPAQGPTVTPSGSRVTEVVPARAKEIPATAQTAMLGNVAAIRKLSGTLDLLRKNPDATGYGPGLLNMLPGQTVNRVMPGGAEARAGLADIGSMIIHDRSGAAVTVGEMEKLKPFIPTVYDDPASAQMKIQRLQTEIEDMLRDYSQTYSGDQNYKENPVVKQAVGAIRPRAPMSGGEDDPNTARLRSKYGLE